MKLYEMTETAKSLYELLENGEIDEQVVLDTMEAIGASEKLESYCYVQKTLEAEIAAFKAEIERLTARKASLEKQVERMKAAQVDFMLATGQKSAAAGTFKLSIRENKSVDVIDESVIPPEFMTVVPETRKPDKKAMLAALKNGEQICGAAIKTTFSVTAR